MLCKKKKNDSENYSSILSRARLLKSFQGKKPLLLTEFNKNNKKNFHEINLFKTFYYCLQHNYKSNTNNNIVNYRQTAVINMARKRMLKNKVHLLDVSYVSTYIFISDR